MRRADSARLRDHDVAATSKQLTPPVGSPQAASSCSFVPQSLRGETAYEAFPATHFVATLSFS